MMFEKDSQSVLFLDIPVWIFQIILPYSFMVISIRFIIGGIEAIIFGNNPEDTLK